MAGPKTFQLDRSFTGAVLVGGASRRMGRDKARLDCGGQSLITRQVQVLRELGAHEILIAAASAEDYLDCGAPVLADRYPGQGPQAGLESVLRVARHVLVVVLAVDLPRMTAGLLSRMLQACREGRGVVPSVGGRLQPLAAWYPKAAHELVVARLDAGLNSVRGFASACADRGLVDFLELKADLADEFTNWNWPGDVDGESVQS